MKATFDTKNTNGHSVGSNRKERHFYRQFTAVNKDLQAVITLRLYRTQATLHCCVWVHDRKHDMYVSGGGKTGGYGYHRASEAAQRALNAAGIVLSDDIGGRGDSAIEEGLSAIMNALGFRKHVILDAHC